LHRSDFVPLPLKFGRFVRSGQCGDGRSADHATVGDDTGPPNPEAAAMPFDDRQQGGHIGGVAGPQEGGDRPVLLIQHDAQHDLIDTSK
jgi:hypothetical protein